MQQIIKTLKEYLLHTRRICYQETGGAPTYLLSPSEEPTYTKQGLLILIDRIEKGLYSFEIPTGYYVVVHAAFSEADQKDIKCRMIMLLADDDKWYSVDNKGISQEIAFKQYIIIKPVDMEDPDEL